MLNNKTAPLIQIKKRSNQIQIRFPKDTFLERKIKESIQKTLQKYSETKINYSSNIFNVSKISINSTSPLEEIISFLFGSINNYPNFYPYNKHIPKNMNTRKPILSCIIAITHNEEYVINQTIPALFKNTLHIPFEIIIINNDLISKKHLFSDLPVNYIDAPETYGVSRAYNLGIHAAKGEYIAILHDDCCITDERWAEKCIESIDHARHHIFLSGKTEIFFNHKLAVGTPFMAFHKDIVIRFGVYDEAIFYGLEEIEYSARLLSNDIPIVDAPINIFHLGAGSSTILFNKNPTHIKKLIGLNILPKEALTQYSETKGLSCFKIMHLTCRLYSIYIARKYQKTLKTPPLEIPISAEEFYSIIEEDLPINTCINNISKSFIEKSKAHIQSNSFQSILDYIPEIRKQIRLDIELSSDCNVTCSFCPREHIKRENPRLGNEQLLSILKEVSALIEKSYYITMGFCGMGEPLLNQDGLFLALKYLENNPFKDKITTVLVTNNTLINNTFIHNPLLKYLDTIIISASGASYTEYTRLYKYSWETTLLNIKKIHTLYPHIKMSISAINYLGSKTPSLNQNEIYLSCKENQIPYTSMRLHSRGGFLYQSILPQKTHCSIYNKTIFISSDTKYLSCCHDLTQANTLGEIANNHLLEILEKKSSFPKEKPFEICKYCDDHIN